MKAVFLSNKVMLAPPSVLFVFDLGALLNTTAREWPDFSRLGVCAVPQSVFEEIQYYASGRAPEVEQEKTAREFLRFSPESLWQVTTAQGEHPGLMPLLGQEMSRQARMKLAIAQCAYGLAEEQLEKLIVLVSDSPAMRQRCFSLNVRNLCAITSVELRQWSRSHQRPLAVVQRLQMMIRAESELLQPLASPKSRSAIAHSAAHGASHPHAPAGQGASRSGSSAVASRTHPSPTRSRVRVSEVKSMQPDSLSQIVSLLLSLLGLAVAVGVGWRMLSPASFQEFWQRSPAQSRELPHRHASLGLPAVADLGMLHGFGEEGLEG